MISLDDVLKTILILAISVFLFAMAYFISKLLIELRRLIKDVRKMAADAEKVTDFVGSTADSFKNFFEKNGIKKFLDTVNTFGAATSFFGKIFRRKKEENKQSQD